MTMQLGDVLRFKQHLANTNVDLTVCALPFPGFVTVLWGATGNWTLESLENLTLKQRAKVAA